MSPKDIDDAFDDYVNWAISTRIFGAMTGAEMPPLPLIPPLIETVCQPKKKTLGEVFEEMDAECERERNMFAPPPLSSELEVVLRNQQAREREAALRMEEDPLDQGSDKDGDNF